MTIYELEYLLKKARDYANKKYRDTSSPTDAYYRIAQFVFDCLLRGLCDVEEPKPVEKKKIKI